MADNKLSVRRVEGVVDGTVAATLSQLLRLTSDAVIVFNMEGMVLLANEEAESLFAQVDGTIAGLDVRAGKSRKLAETVFCRIAAVCD